jgi:hypothetical protein
MRLDLFLEGYNVFNHANYLAPSGVLSSSSFLIRTAALNPRQMQIGLRFRTIRGEIFTRDPAWTALDREA